MSVRMNELRRDLLLEYLEATEASDAAALEKRRGADNATAYWYALGVETAARRALELLELRSGRRNVFGRFEFDARELLAEARELREDRS